MNARLIAIATLVAGSLDIASAILLTLARGRPVARMLQGIASGPFGNWPLSQGTAGAALGLAVHFAIMALMVATYALLVRRVPLPLAHPWIAGTAYGALLYLLMYWVVLPLRWPANDAPATLATILVPLAVHIALVGLPIALLAKAFQPTNAIPGLR